MGIFLAGIAATIATAALFFFLILVSTLFGGITGWVVGMVFPYVITTVNAVIGTQLTAFEVGAVLGFVGSFFRSSNATKSDSK